MCGTGKTSPEDRQGIQRDEHRRRGIPRRVVVFIHVFKTGGSSIRRELMDMAGEKLGLGCAVIVRGKVKRSKDRHGRCRDHHGSLLLHPEMLDFVRHNGDFLAGHQLFDTANSIWPELPESAFRKIVYIREPLYRFVSGQNYIIAKRKRRIHVVHELVDRIRQNVQQQSEPNIRYWKDLATMDESNDPELYNNFAKQVEIIKSRLERLAMVGVLERWEPSLKLLQRVVDPARLLRETSRRHANQSRISTGHVVQRIRNDVTLYEEILHLLRYEQEIYEHGLRLHLAQCARAGIG